MIEDDSSDDGKPKFKGNEVDNMGTIGKNQKPLWLQDVVPTTSEAQIKPSDVSRAYMGIGQ